ncbi:hypothetical protein KP509_04G093200 [Ceratopteris richardii]|uniref:Uncharacterized protein n=1 Tax=Ceratopteris richardii TaxID=49495 RepID=A0A8T2V2V8_CERRI|nr:hypothetical protein KP509_04G093200 [Ceratopteris richardii]
MDPWSELIRRVQAFRNALVQASEDTLPTSKFRPTNINKNGGRKHDTSFDVGLLQNILAEKDTSSVDSEDSITGDGHSQSSREEEDEEDREEEGHGKEDGDLLEYVNYEQERPDDLAEEALLQELFFPADVKVASSSVYKNCKGTRPSANSISLSVNVGKLVLCQNIRNTSNRLSTDIGTDTGTDTITPTCLLTLIFPAVIAENREVGCSPEQRISIMPIKSNGDEFSFAHHSQLFWNLPSNEALPNLWRTHEMMTASIEVSTGGGEVLCGNAYLPLQSVVEKSPSTVDLHMVLVRSEPASGNGCGQDTRSAQQQHRNGHSRCQKKSNISWLKQNDKKPLAILEIGLTLVRGVPEEGRYSLLNNMASKPEETWLYVYIHNGLSTMRCNSFHPNSQSLLLVIKFGIQSVRRLFYRSINNAITNHLHGVLPGKFSDALLKLTDRTEGRNLFVEVWCNICGSSKERRDGLENLIGLAKVTIPTLSRGYENTSSRCLVDGSFSLWHPRSDSEGQKLRLTVYGGSKSELLRVLQETRSAITIQRHGRMLLERIQNKRHDGKLSLKSKGETFRHVFEVTVQRAKHIPLGRLSNNDHGYTCRGLFIKYNFPREEDPLFTHDMELQETVVFGAVAHHRITLPQGQSLLYYFTDLDENTCGLRFELWSNVLENSENKYDKVSIEKFSVSEDQEKSVHLLEDRGSTLWIEKCIGTAVLPMHELLSFLKNVYKDHVSLKIKRVFNLPIKFKRWVECQGEIPYLTIQVAYDIVELAESHLLDGTIFHDHMNASQFPLKSLLEVAILDIKINQNQSMSLLHMDVLCIRFALFPCNRELENKHPPIVAQLDKGVYHAKFTLNVILDAVTIKELWESYMTFEIWRISIHEAEGSGSSKDRKQDVRIGVAIAPCVMLLSQKQGVSGCIDLVGLNRQPLGHLRVSVKFVSTQVFASNV